MSITPTEQDREERIRALALAEACKRGIHDPSGKGTVALAQAFYAFLRGDSA